MRTLLVRQRVSVSVTLAMAGALGCSADDRMAPAGADDASTEAAPPQISDAARQDAADAAEATADDARAGEAGAVTCDDGAGSDSFDAGDASGCVAGGCPLHLPSGLEWSALISPAAGQVWVLGFPRAALRWDGSAWSGAPGDAPIDFEDAWIISGDVWAAGYGGVARWDGAGWLLVGSLDVARAIWGSSANDVWAGGRDGMTHWNGQIWLRDQDGGASDPIEVWDLWGAAPDDVWAVGNGVAVSSAAETRWGRILHWNGNAWSELWKDASDGIPVTGVWGSASDDVWAVRQDQGVLHWDGKSWSPSFAGGYTKVWGVAPGDVWFIGEGALLRRMGDSSSPMRIGCHDGPPIAGSGPDDLFVTHRDPSGRPLDVLHWSAN